MSHRNPQTASSLQPTSLLHSIKTYLFNIEVSDYNELERELRKLNTDIPVFDYEHGTPVLPTHSVTDYESYESESDVEPGRSGYKVINITPRNKNSDYSVLNDFFDDGNSPEGTNANNTDDNNSIRSEKVKSVLASTTYDVSDNESLNMVALKFDVSPNMLKQLNALTTDFIFPGQSLLVPNIETAQSTVIETLLHPVNQSTSQTNNHASPKKSIFKYPMKRITRFDGSVAGTTLMTSNAFMFRAHVSDNLVIQNGQNTYNVSIPLDSISEILMFESFDQMLANIQSTTGTQNACEKCTEVKFQLCHGTPVNSGNENVQMDVCCGDEQIPMRDYPKVEFINQDNDFDHEFEGSATPESNSLDDFLEQSSGEIQLGQSPVPSPVQLYSPTCEHEFEGFGCLYSTKKRVNPFSIGDNSNKLLIPSYMSNIDLLNNCSAFAEGRVKRTDSDTSLATKEFFEKIDENTNQMQSLLDNANNHEYSIFVSIHAICCTRTHGKPSYRYETEEGYSKAHFWICVPEQDVTQLMDNLSDLCTHLTAVDDSSNCLMKCAEDHYTRLSDVILPDKKQQFMPREVNTDLMSEPFSGNLNYPAGKPVMLTVDMMSELQAYFPCHIIGIDVLLVYSMKLHGMSLRSLYNHCEPYQDVPCILLIRDTQNYVFGAYLSDGIVESPKYYGSGETFLFRLSPDTKCYFWQGANHYFMMGTSDYFTVGAGDGNFALYIDEMLQDGTSNRSLTFYNDVLSSDSSFSILTVEVWCFTDETFEEPGDCDSLSSDQSKLSGQFRGSFYNIR